MRHHTPRAIALVTIMAIMTIALWAWGMSARQSHLAQMGRDIASELIPPGCVITHEVPSGPEPEVSIWHRHIRCGNHTYVMEFSALAPCGFVYEGEEMIPSACVTDGELTARMDRIRDERSGLRTWMVTR